MKKTLLTILLSISILFLSGCSIPFLNNQEEIIESSSQNDYIPESDYVAGELLIQLYEGSFDLSSEEGMSDFLSFLENKSYELTPIIAEKLIVNGKLDEDDVTEKWTQEMQKSLITYKKSFAGSNAALLSIAIDNAPEEISEELNKDSAVESASPNYVIDFSDLDGKVIPGQKNNYY